MAKDWRKYTAAAELSRRLDKFETALRRHEHNQELRRQVALSEMMSSPPVRKKLMGKEWVETAFKRRPDVLRVMKITDAAEVLAKESENASDCAKKLTMPYVRNVLRSLNVWALTYRNSRKKHHQKRSK